MRLALVALLAVASCAPASELPGGQPSSASNPRGKASTRNPARSLLSPRAVLSRPARRADRDMQRAPLHVVTMYCYTGSRNAAGKWPTVGTAAGNAWPLGTRLYVESVGVVTVEDRSAPGATDVDVYGGSDSGCAARAAAFGRRLLHVSEVAA